jgi:hypothetical protein
MLRAALMSAYTRVDTHAKVITRGTSAVNQSECVSGGLIKCICNLPEVCGGIRASVSVIREESFLVSPRGC